MAKMLTTLMSVATGGEGGSSGGGGMSESRAAAAHDVSIVDILGESQRRRLSLVASSNSSSLVSPSVTTTADSGLGSSSAAKVQSSPTSEDVYAQLAQKETDLILAAELGKALLEKNEELRRQNDSMADGFQARIEVSIQWEMGNHPWTYCFFAWSVASITHRPRG